MIPGLQHNQALDPGLQGMSNTAMPPRPMPTDSKTAPQNSLVVMKSNADLELAERKEAESRQQAPLILSLVGYLNKQWDSARRAKDPIQIGLLQDIRQRNGEYDPDKLQTIREQGMPEIFMQVTSMKCRTAVSWIRDIMLNPDQRPWELCPTPAPELPPDVEKVLKEEVVMQLAEQLMAQGIDPSTPQALAAVAPQFDYMMRDLQKRMDKEAKELADRHSVVIEDEFVEGGFYKALDEVIDDVVTFKAGFLKGPIIRRRPVLKWSKDAGGKTVPVEGAELRIEYERRSPMDIYPGPDSVDIQASYMFDRQKLSVDDLYSMIGCPGYDDGAIRQVIEEHGRGGLRNWLWHDYQRTVTEQHQHELLAPSTTIEALEYWGNVPGFMLMEWGMDPALIPDRQKGYSVNAWMIGRWVIKATLNKAPFGKRPYGTASFENIPGSFWGRGVPELMRDVQTMCNATARALMRNMGIASGPQVVINDMTRLPKSEDFTDLHPWKIWQFKPDAIGNGQKPIDFFQPGAMTNELLEVFTFFDKKADEVTGVPSYQDGDATAGGAARTASGLAQLMGASSRGIKHVVANIDAGVIVPAVEGAYYHNMIFHEDESIKGDLKPLAKGSSSLAVKDQAQIRRTEFLAATANPIDMEILGLPGRASVLREVASSLDMDVDAIVPDQREMEERAKLLMMTQQQAMLGQGAVPGQEQGDTSGQPGASSGGANNAPAAPEQGGPQNGAAPPSQEALQFANKPKPAAMVGGAKPPPGPPASK
jgi:hypothetical protein